MPKQSRFRSRPACPGCIAGWKSIGPATPAASGDDATDCKGSAVGKLDPGGPAGFGAGLDDFAGEVVRPERPGLGLVGHQGGVGRRHRNARRRGRRWRRAALTFHTNVGEVSIRDNRGWKPLPQLVADLLSSIGYRPGRLLADWPKAAARSRSLSPARV